MAITGTAYEELLRQNDAALDQIRQAQALTTRRNSRYVSPYAEEIGALLGQASAQRTYTSPYAQQIDDLAGQLRESKFTYDRDADPNYQAMRKQWLLEADRTASDVLAKASAPTGGRASTYAITAASQAADYYKSQLSTQQQALFDSAYDRYYKDYTKRLQDLETLQGRENTDYTRWQNDYAHLLQRLQVLQGQDNTDYSRWNTDYQNLIQLIATTGYSPTSDEMAATGMTADEAASWRNYYAQQLAASYGSGGGGRSYGGGSSGSYGSGYGNTSGSGTGTYSNGMTDDSIARAAYAYAVAHPSVKAESSAVKSYLQSQGYNSSTANVFTAYLDRFLYQMKNPTGEDAAKSSKGTTTSSTKTVVKPGASSKKDTTTKSTSKTAGGSGKRTMSMK